MTGPTREPDGAAARTPAAHVSANRLDPEETARALAVSAEALATVWREYKQTGAPAARERLILHYAPLVRYVAGRVGVGLPPNVEQGDLVSYGIFGLIDAIEKYDMSRAIKFETYAINRIRGAIIDELRSIDWIPRSVRTKARDVERAIATLESRLQRTPTEVEIADELGLTVAELRQVFSQVSFVNVAALDEMLGSAERGERSTLGDTLEDERIDAPGLSSLQRLRPLRLSFRSHSGKALWGNS